MAHTAHALNEEGAPVCGAKLPDWQSPETGGVGDAEIAHCKRCQKKIATGPNEAVAADGVQIPKKVIVEREALNEQLRQIHERLAELDAEYVTAEGARS